MERAPQSEKREIMSEASARERSHGEWSRILAYGVTGLLLFETLSGLVILLLPFVVYQLGHWRRYRTVPMSALKLTGYLALLSTLAASVTGVVLTWQAWFGTRISDGVDLVHIGA